MHKLNIIFFSFIILISNLGCGNSTQESTNKSKSVKKNYALDESSNLAAGKINDNIVCVNNSENSYAIYLPENYSDSNLFPVLFLFDSHGRGKFSIEKYKSLADEFGLIIACSNSSKNGQSESEQNIISYQFIEDVNSKFKIDNSKFFLGGFSGGARVAVQVASINNQVSGVIGCSAGLPNKDMVDKINFSYFLTAGNIDFNYLELKSLTKELKNSNTNFYFMEFDGIHEWPPLNVMKEAIYFLYFNAQKKDESSNKSALVESYISYENTQLNKAVSQNNILEQVNIYERMSIFLKNNTSTNNYKNKYKQLCNNSIYKLHQKNNEMFLQMEPSLQAELASNITAKDSKWWSNKIDEIIQSSRMAKSKEEKLMHLRLLNYMSLISFMYADNALKNNKLDESQKYLSIYEKVDPNNSEVYYLQAVFYAKQNKNDLALVSLEKAVSKGFDDFERIRNDNNFHFSEIELELIRKAQK